MMRAEDECSFCGKPRSAVRRLVDGPRVSICNECVVAAFQVMLGDDDSRAAQPTSHGPPPRLYDVKDIKELDPHWPWTQAATYRYIRDGKLTCVRLGKRVLLRAEDLIAFQRKHGSRP